jgi:hypothetical protein
MLEEVRQLNKALFFPDDAHWKTVIVGYRENGIKEALGI